LNFSLYIAKRYYRSQKKDNVINIITRVAIAGVMIGTAALIIVLSAFNGIENLVISLYNTFDPEIKIEAAKGKSFDSEHASIEKVKQLESIAAYSEIVEENALLKHKDKQYIARIKGVETNYLDISRLDTVLLSGEFNISSKEINYAVLGYGVAINLGVNLNDLIRPIQVYVPGRKKSVTANPMDAFKSRQLYPTGVFSIQHEFDTKYVFASIDFMREILDYEGQTMSLEIKVKEGFDVEKVVEEINAILGDEFTVKDRFQQNEFLYKVMKSEKWVVYFILTFILIIAAFNIVSSVTMLIIDKKKDLKILWSLGAENSVLRKAFLTQGMMITFTGAILGLVLGGFVCWLQITFSIITVPGDFVMEAYPITIKFIDFIYVFFTVTIIGFFASMIPVWQFDVNKIQSKL
jgi:lipoprotein-releasing system permease protein